MTETIENGVYQVSDDGEILCIITDLGNNIYRAVNTDSEIMAEIKPLDEYRTYTRCIENKRKDKNGYFRKTKKLAKHNTSWLAYMIEEKGFIRKTLVTES